MNEGCNGIIDLWMQCSCWRDMRWDCRANKGTPLFPIYLSILSYSFFFFYTKRLQDVAAYIKKEFDKKHNPTW